MVWSSIERRVVHILQNILNNISDISLKSCPKKITIKETSFKGINSIGDKFWSYVRLKLKKYQNIYPKKGEITWIVEPFPRYIITNI